MSENDPDPEPEPEPRDKEFDPNTERDTELRGEDLRLFVVAYRPENAALDAETIFENLSLSPGVDLHAPIATADRDLFERVASQAHATFNDQWGVTTDEIPDGDKLENLPRISRDDVENGDGNENESGTENGANGGE